MTKYQLSFKFDPLSAKATEDRSVQFSPKNGMWRDTDGVRPRTAFARNGHGAHGVARPTIPGIRRVPSDISNAESWSTKSARDRGILSTFALP